MEEPRHEQSAGSPEQPAAEHVDATGTHDKARGPRLREIPLRLMVPNMITSWRSAPASRRPAGIRESVRGSRLRWFSLPLSRCIDGRIARLLKATSSFGVQMDSLADIINFGVAPALVLYVFLLDQARSLGWIAALIYAIAVGLRLARFNVMAERQVKASWQSEYFVGVPAPAGAMLVLLPVYLGLLGLAPERTFALIASLYTVLIASLWSAVFLSGPASRRTASAGSGPSRHSGRRLLRGDADDLYLETMVVTAVAYLVSLPIRCPILAAQIRRLAGRPRERRFAGG